MDQHREQYIIVAWPRELHLVYSADDSTKRWQLLVLFRCIRSIAPLQIICSRAHARRTISGKSSSTS